MAEPVTLLTEDDLDRAMCDVRADGSEIEQAVVAEAVVELRRLRRDPRLLPVIEDPNPAMPRAIMPVTVTDERLMGRGHWSLLLGHGICPWPSCGGFVGDVELVETHRGIEATRGFCPRCAGGLLAVPGPRGGA